MSNEQTETIEEEVVRLRATLVRVEKLRQRMALVGAIHWCSELAKATRGPEIERPQVSD